MKRVFIIVLLHVLFISIRAQQFIPYQCASGSFGDQITTISDTGIEKHIYINTQSTDGFFSNMTGDTSRQYVGYNLVKTQLDGNGKLVLKRNVNIILDTFQYSIFYPSLLSENGRFYSSIQREIPDSTYGDAQDYLALSVYDKDLNIIDSNIVIARAYYNYITGCGKLLSVNKIIDKGNGDVFLIVTQSTLAGGDYCNMLSYSLLTLKQDGTIVNHDLLGNNNSIDCGVKCVYSNKMLYVISYRKSAYGLPADIPFLITKYDNNGNKILSKMIQIDSLFAALDFNINVVDDKIICYGTLDTDYPDYVSKAKLYSFDTASLNFNEITISQINKSYNVSLVNPKKLIFIISETDQTTYSTILKSIRYDRNLNQILNFNGILRQDKFQEDYLYSITTENYLKKINADFNDIWSAKLSDSINYDNNYYKDPTIFYFTDYYQYLENQVVPTPIYKSALNNQSIFVVKYTNSEVSKEIYAIYYVDNTSGAIILKTTVPYVIKYLYDNNTSDLFAIQNSDTLCSSQLDIVVYKLLENKNTIFSKAFLDYNSDGLQDANEPAYNQGSIKCYNANRSFQIQKYLNSGVANIETDTGIFFSQLFVPANLFSIFPVNDTSVFTTLGNTDTLLFALQPIGTVNDASISLVNTFISRPGLENTYLLSAENKGNKPINNASIKLVLDNHLTLENCNFPFTQSGDTIIFLSINLDAGEVKNIYINFLASSVLEVGDTLTSKAFIQTNLSELYYINNSVELTDEIRGSFDPNNKTANASNLPNIGIATKAIVYTIQFENIGNDTAFNIIIRDTLSKNLNLNSLILINTSHSYTLTIEEDSILVFTFKNILLPASIQNQDASHGFVCYEVQPISNQLESSFDVKNTAHIIFDYNKPISTNIAVTRISNVLNVKNNSISSADWLAYPNPVKNSIRIDVSKINTDTYNLKLCDIDGKLLTDKNYESKIVEINLSNISNGVYTLYLITSKGTTTKKIIVQH